MDPKIDDRFDIVRDQALSREMNYVMSNSFGFGGTNAALLFKHFSMQTIKRLFQAILALAFLIVISALFRLDRFMHHP